MYKKTIFITLFICLFALAGCSHSTNQATVSNQFLGTWELTSVMIDNEKQDTDKMDLSYTFNDDSVVLQTNDGKITAGTYTTSDNSATMTFESGDFTAKLSDGTLTIDQSGCVYKFKKQS